MFSHLLPNSLPERVRLNKLRQPGDVCKLFKKHYAPSWVNRAQLPHKVHRPVTEFPRLARPRDLGQANQTQATKAGEWRVEGGNKRCCRRIQHRYTQAYYASWHASHTQHRQSAPSGFVQYACYHEHSTSHIATKHMPPITHKPQTNASEPLLEYGAPS